MIDQSNEDSTMVAIFNTSTLSPANRRFLAALLREAVRGLPDRPGLRQVKAHIAKLEPGYSERIDWDTLASGLGDAPKRTLKLLMDPPDFVASSFQDAVHRLAKSKGAEVEFVTIKTDKEIATGDATLIAFPMTKGRQKWVEGAIPTLGLAPLMEKAPKTLEALHRAQIAAASTMPVEAEILAAADKAIFEEASIAPVYRTKSRLYSRVSSKLRLRFIQNDDVIIEQRSETEGANK